jgi:hypothetical protein
MYSMIAYQPQLVQTVALAAGADGRLAAIDHESTTRSRRLPETERRTVAERLDQSAAPACGVAEEQHVRATAHPGQDRQRRPELLSSDGDQYEVVGLVQSGRIDCHDRPLRMLPGLGILQDKPASLQIDQPRATSQHHHVMPVLEQCAGVHAADYAGAKNKDSPGLARGPQPRETHQFSSAGPESTGQVHCAGPQ